jgi:uncharacterized protein YjbI with pentapeptide repeats
VKEAEFTGADLTGVRIARVVSTGTNFCRATLPDGERGKCPPK